jgi:hypothetical protein
MVYPQGGDIFIVNSDGSQHAQLTNNPSFPPLENSQSSMIAKLAASPNGDLLAMNIIVAKGVANGGWQEESSNLTFFDLQQSSIVATINETGNNFPIYRWSPDGQWLAFSYDFSQGLSLVNINTFEVLILQEPDSYVFPDWSEDSQWLTFVDGSSLFLWSANTFEVQELANAAYIWNPAWSPDGIQGEEIGLLIIEPGSNSQRRLNLNLRVLGQPIWSLDSQWIVFYGEMSNQTGLYIVHSSDEGLFSLLDTTGTNKPYDFVWLP